MRNPRNILSLAAVLLLAAACRPVRAQQSAIDFTSIDAHLHQAADAALTLADDPVPPAHPAPNAAGASLADSTPPAADPHLGNFAPTVLPILAQHGLPRELASVIAVESGGNPQALSPKGARGLWQLMPATARRYGLVVNGIIDERLDPVRSTQAAASYLRDLYTQFGSWPLALAAYNWGEEHLAAAMQRTRATDFFSLSVAGALPAETRAYVPAVLVRWQRSAILPSSSNPFTTTVAFATQLPLLQRTTSSEQAPAPSRALSTSNEN